jgi:hypothetical protein
MTGVALLIGSAARTGVVHPANRASPDAGLPRLGQLLGETDTEAE